MSSTHHNLKVEEDQGKKFVKWNNKFYQVLHSNAIVNQRYYFLLGKYNNERYALNMENQLKNLQGGCGAPVGATVTDTRPPETLIGDIKQINPNIQQSDIRFVIQCDNNANLASRLYIMDINRFPGLDTWSFLSNPTILNQEINRIQGIHLNKWK